MMSDGNDTTLISLKENLNSSSISRTIEIKYSQRRNSLRKFGESMMFGRIKKSWKSISGTSGKKLISTLSKRKKALDIDLSSKISHRTSYLLYSYNSCHESSITRPYRKKTHSHFSLLSLPLSHRF